MHNSSEECRKWWWYSSKPREWCTFRLPAQSCCNRTWQHPFNSTESVDPLNSWQDPHPRCFGLWGWFYTPVCNTGPNSFRWWHEAGAESAQSSSWCTSHAELYVDLRAGNTPAPFCSDVSLSLLYCFLPFIIASLESCVHLEWGVKMQAGS